ncbi:MAG: FlgD immunoglobulin-like domain containing protein, partial [Spirochaetia bacterium]
SAPAHNISDVGVGFATPVFALNTSVQRDPARGGVGMVTNFDGTHWLLPEDVLLEAKILVPPLVLPTTTLSLFWDVNPPASLAFNNLWIPSTASTFWSPLTNPGGDRAHNPNSEAHTAAAPAVNGALSDFRIPGADSDVKDGALLQLMFVLDDGALPTPHRLPLAYQADPNNPGSVRPFEYSYHSIIAQRGNVTITNNVIHPANGESAYLHYVMPKAGKISITVFTLSGDIVNVLANGTQNAGEYTTGWDGKNRGGRIVARGIYFVRVVGPGFDEMRKVLVVR